MTEGASPPTIPACRSLSGIYILECYMELDDLISRIAARNPKLQRDDAELGVRVIVEAISAALTDGRRVEIRGFGSFGLTYKASRTTKNPRNGLEMSVLPKHVPNFRAGKELRGRVDCGANPESGLKLEDGIILRHKDR